MPGLGIGIGVGFGNGGAGGTPAPAWTPAQLSKGVEYWDIASLVSLGDGVVAPSWTGLQLGAVLSPFSGDTDIGTVKLASFLGDVATQPAGLKLASRAGLTADATVCGVFNGTNKVWCVWMVCQLDSSVQTNYWGAGNATATNEYVQARYLPVGTIKNNMALRDGVALNSSDSVTEYQTMCPQLLRWDRVAGGVTTIYADEISQGSTPARTDAGIAVNQFGIGCTTSGPAGGGNSKNAAYTINALGVTTGFSAADITNLAAWVWPRVGLNWKKGLNP